jgi:hypothetical protein
MILSAEGSVLLATMLLLAGCGKVLPAPVEMSTPIPSATMHAPDVPSTPIPPTDTTVPTASLTAKLSTPLASRTPAKMPKGPGVEWHLVVVSESSGWGLGEAYASQIEKDVGVKVTVDDFAIGDLSAGDVLDQLQNGKSSVPELEGLPTALANADVVILFPSPMRSVDDDAFLNIQLCFGNAEGTPTPCSSKGFEKYTADLETIWGKVFEYRAGKPTILRALDYADPFVSRWNENQIFEACTTCWECGSAAARKAAEAFHIPFLSRYDVFNGPDHNLDLGQQEYLGGDGIHPNDAAQQRTAELLSKLGYEPVTPP